MSVQWAHRPEIRAGGTLRGCLGRPRSSILPLGDGQSLLLSPLSVHLPWPRSGLASDPHPILSALPLSENSLGLTMGDSQSSRGARVEIHS